MIEQNRYVNAGFSNLAAPNLVVHDYDLCVCL